MVKKVIHNFIKIIIISLIFLTTLIISGSNPVHGAFNTPTVTFDNYNNMYTDHGLNHNQVYCIDHGYSYRNYSWYKKYETVWATPKSTAQKIMFLVANRKPKSSEACYNDAIANAIWKCLSRQYDSSNIKANILYDIANEASKITPSGNLSIIQQPDDMYLYDGEILGPFRISYPQYNYTGPYPELYKQALQELTNKGLGTLTIKVNGKILKEINGKEVEEVTANLQEFNFTEADEIQYGEENIVEFIYTGDTYGGYYEKYTPYKLLCLDVTCPEENCKAQSTATYTETYTRGSGLTSLLIGGKKRLVAYNYNINNWSCGIVHSKDCKYAGTNYWGYETADYYGQNYISDKNGFYDTSKADWSNAEGNKLASAQSGKPAVYNGWQNIIYVKPSTGHASDYIKLKYYPLSDLDIDLSKIDNVGSKMANRKFDVTISGGLVAGTSDNKMSITTDSTGKASFTIRPTSINDITLTLVEEKDQYYVDVEPIVITLSYKEGEANWYIKGSQDFVSTSGVGTKFGITVENTPKIENLVIKKVNANADREVLPGVTFRITLNNAKTLDGINSITRTTDANGQINIGEIAILDPNKQVSVTLEETGVPDNGFMYNGLGNYDSATISFYYRKEGLTIDNDLISGNYNVSTNEIEIEIENYVTMSISGKVWQDEPVDQKENGITNNLKDAGEQGVSNVIVDLLDSNNNNSLVSTVITDSNGQYAFNIPASVNSKLKYSVRFRYDGVNNIAVTPNVGRDETRDSDATEIGRTSFNTKFKTVEKGVAISPTGGRTSLEYAYIGNSAILQTIESTGIVKDKYAIIAETDSYGVSTSNVDLGLAKREVDLSARTYIQSATIKVNGKEQIINYSNLLSQTDENGNLLVIVEGEEIKKYNLYLYLSDYNYRIDDYGLKPEEAIEQNKEELKVQVTYEIDIQHVGATVNKIAYYYDTSYRLEGANPELVKLGDKYYNKVILDGNTATLTFTIAKDAEGNLNRGEMKNWVEIISYSTEDGRIDINSAPDNITEDILDGTLENDSDDAPVLHVQEPVEQRIVSGYVFEDNLVTALGEYSKGNGTYEAGENKVSDVIVQLIEIKQVGTQKLEYIRQETVTGSKTVKRIKNEKEENGNIKIVIEPYTVRNEPGHYTFDQYVVAGDYVVRFIYGDDEYYDVAIDGTTTTDATKANINKYNGQDYKSTIDPNYAESKYYRTKYSENSSMARDSEARRLAQMYDATSVTSDKQADLYDLSKTWMYADTSLVNLSIDIASESINFGLVQRPAAYLVLEKHITGLDIDGITEATTSLSDYDNIAYTGESVFVQKTSKDYNSRGSWLVQTEIEKVAGRRIDITYTYTVTNKGVEYIGKKLVDEGYKYEKIASTLATEEKTSGYVITGDYLGKAYYTGTPTNDVPTSISFQVEDYMSTQNGMKLDTTTAFKSAGTATKNVWDYEKKLFNVRKPVNDATELVGVLQSKEIKLESDGNATDTFTMTVYDESIDSTNTDDAYSYRSYAAQVIYLTTGSITSTGGTTCRDMKLSNLKEVQSYVDDLDAVRIGKDEEDKDKKCFVPEDDEFVAETVVITMDTGADKITPVILIISITAGLAVVAVGIVLIKKFVIKK